jgi:hypothetical protein
MMTTDRRQVDRETTPQERTKIERVTGPNRRLVPLRDEVMRNSPNSPEAEVFSDI